MPAMLQNRLKGQLTSSDYRAMQSIYFHRCLNEELLKKYYYVVEETEQPSFTSQRLQWLIQQELLDTAYYGENECAYFLTNFGVRIIRSYFNAKQHIEGETEVRTKYSVRASDLMLNSAMLSHQMCLNSLSLEIESQNKLPPDCYKDSKFASLFTYAQPDGVFELPSLDIFLEMDMANERLYGLKEKWNHYRTYRNSKEYYLHRNKRMVVLFATSKIKRGYSIRRAKVIQAMQETIFDMLGESFECYIGPIPELVEISRELISNKSDSMLRIGSFLQTQLRFAFSRPALIRDACGESYLYMCQNDSQMHPIIRDGTPQCFFLEDYTSRPISVLKRAANYAHTASLLFPLFGRIIPLLLIVPSEQSIYQDLIASDSMGVKDVLFTTESRLHHMILPHAVFAFDLVGNRYHFCDYTFSTTVHEKRGG